MGSLLEDREGGSVRRGRCWEPPDPSPGAPSLPAGPFGARRGYSPGPGRRGTASCAPRRGRRLGAHEAPAAEEKAQRPEGAQRLPAAASESLALGPRRHLSGSRPARSVTWPRERRLVPRPLASSAEAPSPRRSSAGPGSAAILRASQLAPCKEQEVESLNPQPEGMRNGVVLR